MQYYGWRTHILAGNNNLNIKHFKHECLKNFLKKKNTFFADCLWIIVMFLSAVWTLILTAPIHCRGSFGEQVMGCYISPNQFWWINKLIYILDGLRLSKCSANFHFWVINSFNCVLKDWMLNPSSSHILCHTFPYRFRTLWRWCYSARHAFPWLAPITAVFSD